MLLTLLTIQFEISGKEINDLQPENSPLIFVTLSVFHLEISGNDFNDEQLKNNPSKFVTFFIL